MRQVVLLGNPDTKRTIYLEQAAAQAMLPVLFVDWKNWGKLLQERELFLKIDPPLWQSSSLEELGRLTEDYADCLAELALLADGKRNVEFLNPPWTITALLDKRVCKDRLLSAGLPVTEYLGGHTVPGSSQLLLELMREQGVCQVFIKPVMGSGAAGVSAFRVQPSTGRMALYTCTWIHPELGLVNTKRLRCFSREEEIIPLLDRLLAMDCVVERWYAKAEYQGYSYDLRVVMQDGKPDFLLARLSRGPITNLHLNNHPLKVTELGLSPAVLEAVGQLCRESMACFPGLRSAGIDILLGRGDMKPRIIEMNAQGDLIYQDIFHENLIYRHQAEMMKSWLAH